MVLGGFDTLYDALDDQAWLEEKFIRSGQPEPSSDELTVVIEYCCNSRSQLASQNKEHRYAEEAERFKLFLVDYYPKAVVCIIHDDPQLELRTTKMSR